ncbi:hypothetical protein NP233_g22 [Leucocoprinus birnbaumii]|uniref:Fatty acid desaturase domain-containing protein n=1 Tax=Leucocoprinus birnbaumii TaxID=56174 RepID=A0AAD5W4J7_9AGAR|nr:hypothetical protein NP233_g22 [Leucocoprinus birnbaumii]
MVETRDNIKCSGYEQATFTVPDVTLKEMLDVIPPHCFQRSALRSSVYILIDLFAIGLIYKTTTLLDALLDSETLRLSSPLSFRLARLILWSVYGYGTGVFGSALWIIAHECGHRAFSESKLICDTVGLIIHTTLGVPYFSWRISHGLHHAFTGHISKDQAHVPLTRSQFGLQPLDPVQEDPYGSWVTEEGKSALWEALGEAPIVTAIRFASYMLSAWPLYLLVNFHGPEHYPKGSNHFNPNAIMFKPHQYWEVVCSNVAMALWAAGLVAWASKYGVWEVFVLYGVPYLWINHGIVIATSLHHTDPHLPHYREAEFTFTRGALATYDRFMYGDNLLGRLASYATHGISNNHVVHHVCSKIPHYHAWEASVALRKFLRSRGIKTEGAPVNYTETFRVWTACRFVEDDGDIVFYKNAQGIAQMRPISKEHSEVDK